MTKLEAFSMSAEQAVRSVLHVECANFIIIEIMSQIFRETTVYFFSRCVDIVDERGIQLFLLHESMSIQYYIPAVST